MANLSPEQANILANDFLSLAKAIGKYRKTHSDTLSSEEKESLNELYRIALDHSNKLYTLSATLVMNEVESTLSTIGTITSKIKTDYQQVQKVQKAVNIAAAIVNLGASIVDKNPQSIASSVAELRKTWKE